ncbi:MAG: sn-glycerol-1-phosphate dehydrogenase [Spirochaetales bacterium]|nr:sn-glycerol-1-phosphate dehydrogenase [Spirochaetales bacterium]
MAATISYDRNHRLILSGLECDCACQHRMPDQDIYVGEDILPDLPSYIERRKLGRNCVLVCDRNTYPVAGERTERILSDAGIKVIMCLLKRDGDVDPDERSVGEVLLSIQPETEFIVAVGSGSITDTCRVNAARTGLPFVSVGTAPSMDGYTSAVAPLLLRGLKIHRQGPCPEIICCDTRIMATAPDWMIAAGVGDVLGKFIAKADWKIGSIINDEVYCPVCGQIVTDAVNRLIDNVDKIKAKTPEGIQILIEGLLLAGITVLIIGHTRAVASVEHNIAHFWDMSELALGHRAPCHGASVGIGTLMVWPMFTRFAEEDLSKLDLDALRRDRMDRDQRVRWMHRTWGVENGDTIMEENPGDFLTWEEQERRIRRAQERFPEIREVIRELPPVERIRGTLEKLGAPMEAKDLGISDEVRNISIHCAKDYRTRYTLFKLLDECGLLKEYLSDYPLNWD